MVTEDQEDTCTVIMVPDTTNHTALEENEEVRVVRYILIWEQNI